MSSLHKILLTSIIGFWSLLSHSTFAQESIAGTYYAVLQHEGKNVYQLSTITLRTSNPNGTQVKISANVRIYFGKRLTNEFLTYDFPDVPMNLLTRQITMRDDASDVILIGYLKSDSISGEWHSSAGGRVGEFYALKNVEPEPPEGAVLISSLSGYYRGTFTNTGSETMLPPRLSMSFVATQGSNESETNAVGFSGNCRFYMGEFGSHDYTELKFIETSFNFYSRFLTAKTDQYSLTFKGTVSNEGKFEGIVFADGLGEIGEFSVARYPKL